MDATYDPVPNSVAHNPDSVKIAKHTTDTVNVNLKLKTGSTGKVVFQASPITWIDTPPAGTTVTRTSDKLAKITMNNSSPTSADRSYRFSVNYTYTKTLAGGSSSGASDPTIVLEGTGAQHHPRPHGHHQGS